MTSVVISVADPWVGEYHQQRSLACLDDDENCHIHGTLRCCVGDRCLPRLGFFGADDVCLNSWVGVLEQLRLWLSSGRQDAFVYDEGEQGQPAFRFAPDGDRVLVSVVESLLSGGAGDLNWQDVPCARSELAAGLDTFLREFRSILVTAVGEQRTAFWWQASLAELPN